MGGYLTQPGMTRVTATCECCRAPIFPGELTLRPLSNMSYVDKNTPSVTGRKVDSTQTPMIFNIPSQTD